MDENGDPYAGAWLFTYQSGTTTKQASYTSEDLSVAHNNPIVLDSAGRVPTGGLFLSAASYKFVLAPATDDPPTSPYWTVDEVSATAPFNVNVDVAGTAGEQLSDNEVVYLSDGSGSLTAGRWYLADADLAYASSGARMVGIAVPSGGGGGGATIEAGASGAIRVSGRVTGLAGQTISDIYYVSATAGALTNTRPANARVVGVADSATSLVLASVDALTGLERYEDSVIASVGNVGAGEDTLDSHNFAAGRLATNGETIKGIFWGNTANNATGKTLKVHIDDTSVDTTILDVPLTASIAGDWIAEIAVIRTGAATARSCARATDGAGGSAVQLHEVNVTASFTCTWANAVEVRLTGEAGANDDIQVEGGLITLVTV
jgi:hypothetical protein